MKNKSNPYNILILLVSLSINIFAAKDVTHTIREFNINDGVMTFNVYSLCTDQDFKVGPTTFAIEYNSSALQSPFLSYVNEKYNSNSPGYSDMTIITAGNKILITINQSGLDANFINNETTYGELICTVGIYITDVLASSQISWNIMNSSMFQPEFVLLDNQDFIVQGEPNPPLPVELISFEANSLGNKIQLKWSTDVEINNFGFEIERSLKKISSKWDRIGFVKGANNSNNVQEYSFVDESPIGGTKFFYRLKQINTDGTYKVSNSVEAELTPNNFTVYQNYPNPFNPTTVIRFTLNDSKDVNVTIYDQLGQQVAELLNEKVEAGNHEVEFNADGFSSGLYFYRITAGNQSEVKKMMLLK